MPRSIRSDVSWPTSFKLMKVHLRREALAARNVPLFVAAQTRHSALARHSGIASVLGLLADDSGVPAAERESVVRAMVDEYQRAPGPFWSAVLVLGFMPLLGAIRVRMVDPGIPEDELTSIVIAAFLEVASELDVGTGSRLTALRLRQKTSKRAYDVVNGERAMRDLEGGFLPRRGDADAESEWQWPGSPLGTTADDAVVTDLAVALLHEWAGAFLPPEHLDLVAETVVRGTRLWDYVDTVYPNVHFTARVRAYQRLKRLRTRAMERLRTLLAGRRVPKTGGRRS